MKVLQIIPIFKLAGAEIMCENLCYELREQGCDVTAVSLYTQHTPITDRLEAANIRVVYLGKKKGFDFSLFIRLWKLFQKEKPDVVHTHIYAARYALPVAVACGIPARIHTVHSLAQWEQVKAGKVVNGIMFRHFGAIPVALNKEVKETIQEVYSLPGQKIPVIFNGVNLSKCQIKHNYATKEAFTIIHIGRFMDVKNHSLLLHSFSRFVDHYPKARLQLIGEGELQHNMEQLAVEIGIAQEVYFAGLQSDIFPWLHQADVFILTSKYEGMPMTLIEAMGTGLPVIATKVGGIPDIITDGEEGILTESDSEQIAAAMERMMDVEFRQKCGKKARKKAIEQFAADTMAEKYIQLYQELLNIRG